MKWSDFKDNPQDLIGKTVLRTYGSNFVGYSYAIGKIDAVNKETFTTTIDQHKPKSERIKYRLSNGGERAQRTLYSTGNDECTLITEQEADNYRAAWKLKREAKEMSDRLKAAMKNSEKLTHTVLKKLCAILDEYKV